MKIYKIGGCVRDKLMSRVPHDIDYCVVGSTIDEMLSLGFKQVGKDFPVFLHPKTGDEYALARTERKTGNKHTDFAFDFGKNINIEDDCFRRDFTMNSIAEDITNSTIIDMFGGQNDINNKIVRHINAQYFIQDPLRILRALRFCVTLNFNLAPETKILLKIMVKDGMLKDLTPERIWNEIDKALQCKNFYTFITLLDEIGGLPDIFPELEHLKYVPERDDYHGEKNTFNHILLTLIHLNNKFNNIGEIKYLNFGLLAHDLGKILTPIADWPSHPSHEDSGVSVIEKLCTRLKVPNDYKKFAILACKYHMKISKYFDMNISKRYNFITDVTNNFRDKSNLSYIFSIYFYDKVGRLNFNFDYTDFADKMANAYEMFDVISRTSADMFPELLKFKGSQFGKLYRDKRIEFYRKQIKKYKDNDNASNTQDIRDE